MGKRSARRAALGWVGHLLLGQRTRRDPSAGSTGALSWTWKVGSRTTAGSWPVTVACSKGGDDAAATRYLKVM
ncbi:MAG TPA: hypothetical protein VIM30_07245 [Candidatus Limnocylindrales bacterium]